MSALASHPVIAYDFAAPPPGFTPGTTDSFQLYVSDQETFDDNLFRVAPGTVGVPGAIFSNASQSDWVNTATFGGQGKWELGRQEFELNLRADENRFAKNDALDYVSANAVGYWNWRAGPYLTGQVAVFWDRSLASFSETRYAGRDLVTSLEELGFGRYQIGPHWAAYGQVRGSYTQHSADAEQFNNFHNRAGYAGVEYASNASDTYAFEYQYVDITFKQDFAVATQAYNYKEDSGRIKATYAVTDKSTLSGYAGYLRREYPGLPIGAYSGDIWRAQFQYNLTDKTQFIASAWHELHAYVDAQSNYFVAKGFSFSPVWNATEKLGFVLLASHEDQDYIGSNNTVIAAGPRRDKVNSEQATVRYTPRDAWIINLFVRHEKRTSNQLPFSFSDNLASANVTFRFW